MGDITVLWEILLLDDVLWGVCCLQKSGKTCDWV